MTPPIRLDFLSGKGYANRKNSAKNEHLIIVQMVGGVMTPPYKAIPNRAIN
jgi:hypothetical protein